MDVYLRRHRNIAMEPEDPEVTKNFDMPMTSYLSHLQHQKMKDVSFTADLIKSENRFIEYLKLKDTELNKGNQLVRKKLTETKIGVTQILKTRGMELNNKTLPLRKKKTKEMIGVTQNLRTRGTEPNNNTLLLRKEKTKKKIWVTQILKTKGTDHNNKNLTLRKKMTKTKISVTQARSERLLTKLIQ